MTADDARQRGRAMREAISGVPIQSDPAPGSGTVVHDHHARK